MLKIKEQKLTIEQNLIHLLDPERDTWQTLGDLVESVRIAARPRSHGSEVFLEIIRVLTARDDVRKALQNTLGNMVTQRHAVLLLATSGIYSETGMMAESLRRWYQKWLPDADDGSQLKAVLGRLFRASDASWLEQIPLDHWCSLLEILGCGRAQMNTQSLLDDVLEAVRVVGHRIAAAGLEPEMLRLDPSLENHASPFLALCEEALMLVNEFGIGEHVSSGQLDDRHLSVLIDQCRQTIVRVRKRAQQLGASFHLTFCLRRLSQHLDRLQSLVSIVSAISSAQQERLVQQSALLCRELVLAECRRNQLRLFWRENTELVALRITENAGKTAEHYITETRSEYWQMLRSAAGGGVIIAFMAINKYLLATLGLPPLVEVLAFCLNYSLGFVLIHVLHLTVATKQPAMTANAIAAALGEAEECRKGRQRDLEPLVTLVARTVRTQLVAILGNIGLAVPISMLLAYAVHQQTGQHLLTPEKATGLLLDIHPFASASLVYAAIAGVCLFLAGLIAGYYDNLCAYSRIPERLFQLRYMQRFWGVQRWQRFTDYVSNNLGALAGNFFFGFLLGGVSGLGYLLGLPLDIRHIAFASAFWAYSMAGLDFQVHWQLAVMAALGVLGIGLVNLVVSFYLAMWVGLKSRGVSIDQRMVIVRAILSRLKSNPREFFLPPVENIPDR